MVGKGLDNLRIVKITADFHDVAVELFLGVLDAELFLMIGAGYGRTAAADCRRTADKSHLLKKQDLQALFGSVCSSRQAGAARADDDDIVGRVPLLRAIRRHGRGFSECSGSQAAGNNGLQQHTT